MRYVARLILLATLMLALAPASVSAHAELVSSTPAAGATLDAAPTEITAEFSQKLGPDGSSLTVVDASGARVDLDDSTVDEPARESMRVSLQPNLGAGTYTVQWKSLSAADGDEAEGDFQFTVQGATASASAAPSAAPSASASARPSPAASAAPSAGASAAASPSSAPAAGSLPDTGASDQPFGIVIVIAAVLLLVGLMVRRGLKN